MGFFLFEDIVSEAEEEELLEYWGADGMVHTLGSEEPRSRRRFFHYGPVLQRSTQGSVKSTLGIVPASCGAMPAIVVRLGLTARIRQRAAGLGDKLMGFDQLYVNRYEAHVGARIDFHHDNPKTMRQVVAGINLGSVCSLQLRPLDRELQGKTISVSMQRRSLYIVSGLCRYHLQHAIPSVTEDRVSLTFRTVNRSCAAPGLWARAWSEVPPDEAVNAHWPLLSPMQDGAEELASDDLNIEG